MSTFRRLVWVYIAILFLLGLYLVRIPGRRDEDLQPLHALMVSRLPKSPRQIQSEMSLTESKYLLSFSANAIWNLSQPINLGPSQSRRSRNQSATPLYAKSYMFPLRIPEQMTMSSIHFHQFLNLVNDWNFTGVEPFVYGTKSTLYGLRSSHMKDPKGSIPYNKLYNSTLQNNYLSECMKRQPDPVTGHQILFVPIIDFLRSSYRKLVLVYFAAHAGPEVLPSTTCNRVDREVKRQNDSFIDCSSAAKTHGMSVRVEQLLVREEGIERLYPSVDGSPPLPKRLKHFKVVQAFCIKEGIRLSLRDLKTFIFDQVGAHRSTDGRNEYSIVFISWQGQFTRPLVESDIKNYVNNCRIPWGTPFYSDYVKNTAKRYINSLNFHGQPYLSIHIRFEKLYETMRFNGERSRKYVDCCMKRLNSAISAVMTKFNISKGNAILNWDYSPFGSTECPILHCKKLANENLKKVIVKPTYVDPKRLGLPENRGLIALIEMNILYSGKVLLTVGHGSYQKTIIESFVATHQEQYISEDGISATSASAKASRLIYGHICNPDKEDVHELVDTLKPNCLAS